MKNTLKSFVLFAFVAFLGIAFSSGCRKKKDTTAKIIVRGVDNELVLGATVRVYAKGDKPSEVDATQPSDYKGEAYFIYNDIYQLGQAGVAVLNIHAEITKAGVLYEGDGIIKIEAETENTETVFVQP